MYNLLPPALQYILEKNNTSTMIQRTPRKQLSVSVDISQREVDKCFKEALKTVKLEIEKNKYNYYKTYLKHLQPNYSEMSIDRILKLLNPLKELATFTLSYDKYSEQMMVKRLLHENKYISKNTKRRGLTVKLFQTEFEGRQVIVKTYLFDPGFKSLTYTIEMNFENEIVFQLYANNIQTQLDFISPELYSWGYIRRISFSDVHTELNRTHKYNCLYLVMEYIPHLILKEASFTPEHMKHIYERVKKIDEDMKGELLHHNDLHEGNIMVSTRSPLPEIVILDFGEADLGPRNPLYKHGII